MSLRARLTAGLLAISGLGLVLLAGVTYATQRAFLSERLDVQARAAVPAVARALGRRGIGPRVPAGAPAPIGDRGGFGSPGGRGRRGVPGIELPPGTYGQRRGPGGRVLGEVVLSYGRRDLPAPALPVRMPAGEPVTVGPVDGEEVHYRAIALATPGGGSTVAAVPLGELDRTLDRLLLVEALVVLAVLVALGTLSWLLVGIGLRPLDRIGRTAGAIAAGDLSRRVSPTSRRTEVGRLGLALNAMLERLEAAFAERGRSEERLRRFIADASHELRTPLASVRGYAELLRMGAAADPADVDKAMRRIESEAERMGVLVEDLLTLARLGEVDARAWVRADLAGLAADAVDDARVADPGRAIELHTDGAAAVTGDPDQLRQVIGNLMANAVAHTSSGTPVEVEVAPGDEGTVELAVRDHGPGLPGGDPEALFERFWRSEGGRARGRSGAGLGLAIVAGIVEAHGGSVSAEDAAGGGARFRVRLPAASVGAASTADTDRRPEAEPQEDPVP